MSHKKTGVVFPESLLGKEEVVAVSEITTKNLRSRIRRRDKESFIVTADLRADRVNLEIDNGRVTRAYIG